MLMMCNDCFRRSCPARQIPEFYKAYVREVQDIIDSNARLEFDAINREHARTGSCACACVYLCMCACVYVSA